MTRFLTDHPVVKWLAVLAALTTLVYGVMQYAWHLEDMRATALQDKWFEKDKEWNEEIIQRLIYLETMCSRGG